jgi:hypothetical protein
VAGLLDIGTDSLSLPVAGLLDVGTDHLGCISQHFGCLVSSGTHRAPHLFHSMARLQENSFVSSQIQSKSYKSGRGSRQWH